MQPAPVIYFYILRTKSECLTSLVSSLTPSGHYCNFFPCKRTFYWKGKKSTNKECCIAVVGGLLRNKHIKKKFSVRLKRLTSAGVSISCESCFTYACVRSHSITTNCIDVTAVRVGRAFFDIYIQTCCSLHKYVIFIMFALKFWSSLQGNIFEKSIHKYTLNTLQEKKLCLHIKETIFTTLSNRHIFRNSSGVF